MPWVKLDDCFPDHRKVMAVGPLASWLHVCALCYCARLLTDGFVPSGQVRKLADVDDAVSLVAVLVREGLWEATEGGYRIHDYLDYNPSREQVDVTRTARAEAGHLGGKRSAASREAKAKQIASTVASTMYEAKSNSRTRTHPIPDSHTHTQNPEPDQKAKALAPAARKTRETSETIPPPKEDVAAYFDEHSTKTIGRKFWNHYEANGWMVGKNKMRNWHAAAAGWIERENGPGNPLNGTGHPNPNRTLDEMKAESMAELRRLGIGE